VIAIVLIVTNVNEATPRPLAPSRSVARSAASTSAGSVAARAARAAPAVAGTASGGSPASTGIAGTSAGSGSGIGSGASGGGQSDPGAGSPWAAAHAQLLGKLRTDATNLDADDANQEIASLPGDCAQLQGDLQIAQGVPQVPSQSDDVLWSAALGDFSQAIAECPNGLDGGDVSKIAEAALASSSGESTLTAMLSQISGKSS
jgi:hypothetical protein